MVPRLILVAPQRTIPSTGSSPQAEQHVAVDQLSSVWTIEVVRQKRLYTEVRVEDLCARPDQMLY